MNTFIRDISASVLLCIMGAVMFIISSSVGYYDGYYYYFDRSAYIITHVFFWIGIVIFILGILNILRAMVARKTSIRGVVFNGGRPVEQTSVTVVGTVLPAQTGYQYQVSQPAMVSGPVYPPQQAMSPTTSAPMQPYANQPYANQSYANQLYANQPYTNQPYVNQQNAVPPPYDQIQTTVKIQ